MSILRMRGQGCTRVPCHPQALTPEQSSYWVLRVPNTQQHQIICHVCVAVSKFPIRKMPNASDFCFKKYRSIVNILALTHTFPSFACMLSSPSDAPIMHCIPGICRAAAALDTSRLHCLHQCLEVDPLVIFLLLTMRKTRLTMINCFYHCLWARI